MILAAIFAALCAFVFAVLFGSRQARSLTLQLAASVLLAGGLLVAAVLALVLVAHH